MIFIADYLALACTIIIISFKISFALRYSDPSFDGSLSIRHSGWSVAGFDYKLRFCRPSFPTPIPNRLKNLLITTDKNNIYNKEMSFLSENDYQESGLKKFVPLRMQPSNKVQNSNISNCNKSVQFSLTINKNIFEGIKIISILAPLVLLILPSFSHAASHHLFYSPSCQVNLNPRLYCQQVREEIGPRARMSFECSVPKLYCRNSFRDMSQPGSGFEQITGKCATMQRNQNEGKWSGIYYDDYYYMNNDECNMYDDRGKENDINKNRIPYGSMTEVTREITALSNKYQYELGDLHQVKSPSGITFKLTPTSKRRLALKSIAITFGPLVTICFIRETIRWHREQKNIKKGFKHLKKQKDVYFSEGIDDSLSGDQH